MFNSLKHMLFEIVWRFHNQFANLQINVSKQLNKEINLLKEFFCKSWTSHRDENGRIGSIIKILSVALGITVRWVNLKIIYLLKSTQYLILYIWYFIFKQTNTYTKSHFNEPDNSFLKLGLSILSSSLLAFISLVFCLLNSVVIPN